MTAPRTPQEAAFKQALKDLVAAAIRSSGTTQGKLAAEVNVSPSTLSKAITPGNSYLSPADITRDIVTACLGHGHRTLTAAQIADEVDRVERLRRAAKEADTALQSGPADASGDETADPDGQTHQGSPAAAEEGDHPPGDRSRGNRYTTRRVVIPALGVLVLVALVLVVGVTATHALLRPDVPGPNLIGDGGLDLSKFCRSYGLTISGEACVADIDLTKACKSEYRRDDLKGVYRNEDPYSGECFTPENQSVGGVREMTSSACGIDYRDLPVTSLVLNNHRWVCSLKIDMSVACVWQYSRLNLQATKDKDNNWICHQLD